MAVFVTLPRGFGSHGWRPRVVVEELYGGIRIRHVSTAEEAMRVSEAWRWGEYDIWPGEVRLFQKEECAT